jgi:O-methyltransferase
VNIAKSGLNIFKNILFICKNSSYVQLHNLPKSFLSLLFHWQNKLLYREITIEVQKELSFYWKNKIEIEVLLDSRYIAGLLSLLLTTNKIQGDIIELGTYKGGSAILMARLLKQIGSTKKIYACDTFAGHPYNDQIPFKRGKGEFSDTNVNYVKAKFKKFGVEESIVPIQGLFEETLFRELSDERFSFAFIDCDLYESTKHALTFLIPRMEHNSIIAMHDYSSYTVWGLNRAVNEQCQKNTFKVNFYPIPHIALT